jgi:tetratricopeptide (TPR) repeat protein
MARPRAVATSVAAVAAVILGTGAATVQPSSACTAPRQAGLLLHCGSAVRQTSSIGRPAEPKDQFVGALRQFLEAVAGQFGDEGPRARAALTSMERALADWDAGIKDDETVVGAQKPTAELRGALGLRYLDRRRLEDAEREFSAAVRLDPKRADIRTFQGFSYGLSDKPVDAARSFAEAAALMPDDPAAAYRLAQFLERSGQAQRASLARQTFRDILQKRPTPDSGDRASPPPFIRVDLLRQVAGVAPLFPPALYADGLDALRAGQYGNAIALLRRAAESDPLTAAGSPSQSALDTAAMLRTGRLSPAIARLAGAIASTPADPELHRTFGMAYWADEQYGEAIEQFKTAVRLRPVDERSRLALADVFVASGNLADAEQTLRAAIQTVPRSGQAHYNLGRLYEFQQRWPEASNEYRAAGDLHPVIGLDFLYATMAHACLAQPDYDCAVDAATKRVDANPNNGDAHRALGEIHLQKGEHDEALTELLAALLVNARDADSFADIAQIQLRTGRYADAVEAARKALEINPAHATAPYALGSALTRVGRPEEGGRALEQFQQIRLRTLEQEQRDWDLKMLKQEATVRLASGDDQAAVAALQKALTYEPDAALSHLTLGRVLKKMGRYREAIASLERARDLHATPEVYRLLAEAYDAAGIPEEGEKNRTAYQRLKEEKLRTSGFAR